MPIYKYPLDITDEQTVALPKGSSTISVLSQNDDLVLYAIISDQEELEPHRIFIRGTGHPTDNLLRSKFLGSHIYRRNLVFHVFEELP